MARFENSVVGLEVVGADFGDVHVDPVEVDGFGVGSMAALGAAGVWVVFEEEGHVAGEV